jgi:hypothetical protein
VNSQKLFRTNYPAVTVRFFANIHRSWILVMLIRAGS